MFGEFFETNYKSQITYGIREGKNFLIIDFAELAKFDVDLAHDLLDHPENVIDAAQDALKNMADVEVKKFNIRFKNLSQDQKIPIRNIRSEHIGKFISLSGIVRQKSDVRPQVTSARFECPACNTIFNVLQLEESFKEPTKCGCGRKGKFRLLSKELVDAQMLTLEEDPENLVGGEQPKRMKVLLKSDLVSPMSDKKTNPGSRVLVNGMVKEIPIMNSKGAQSIRFDLNVDANYIEAMQEDFYEVEIAPEEEEKIKLLAKDPKVYEKLVSSMAPSIYGYEKVKEALLLQLMGGLGKERSDGVKTRGDMHILLVGDPGAGKSQLLKRVAIIAPKARFVSGKGASGAGLTAAVVKDEFLKGWSLEAGALVLANKGICCIDEMDKMTKEDSSAMHEALEQQTISISKANIQATLIAMTTVLAAANPKLGRFDPYKPVGEQIDMPPALISRFDLIFTIKDIPDVVKDEKLARHVLGLHKDPNIGEAEIPTAFLRKYIAYMRQRCHPKLTDGALEEIKNYYVKMRNQEVSKEGGMKAIAITARQLEALVRFAEASAKVRLSDKVTKADAKRATDLLHFCLSEISIDPETGKIDIDRITSGITSTQRNRIVVVKELIEELENKIGKTIPLDELIKEAKAKGIKENEIDDIIDKLRRSGDIFQPKPNFIQRM
jgi:replicative DNA helicase Mcm